MSTQKISIPKWQEWVRGYGERVIKAGQRGMVSGGLRSVAMLQKATQLAPPASGGRGDGGAVNTGAFRRGWRMQAYLLRMYLFNTENYASIIEEGRRPGTSPPRQRIEEWARRRLQLSAEEARIASWPIMQAIKKRGLRGRHIMGNLVKQMTSAVTEEIEREVKREIAK